MHKYQKYGLHQDGISLLELEHILVWPIQLGEIGRIKLKYPNMI